MSETRTFAVPQKLLKSFVGFISPTGGTADDVLSAALRGKADTYSPVFEGFEHAEVPPAGKLRVRLSAADEATLRNEASKAGVSEDEYVAHLIYREVFRRELELMEALDHARGDPAALSRIVLQVGLNEFGPDEEIAEHVAGLIDAMSRWQVSQGGNPLEIDKVLPVGITGSAVPQ